MSARRILQGKTSFSLILSTRKYETTLIKKPDQPLTIDHFNKHNNCLYYGQQQKSNNKTNTWWICGLILLFSRPSIDFICQTDICQRLSTSPNTIYYLSWLNVESLEHHLGLFHGSPCLRVMFYLLPILFF